MQKARARVLLNPFLAKASLGTSLHVGRYAQTDGGTLASSLFTEIFADKSHSDSERSTSGSTWGARMINTHLNIHWSSACVDSLLHPRRLYFCFLQTGWMVSQTQEKHPVRGADVGNPGGMSRRCASLSLGGAGGVSRSTDM